MSRTLSYALALSLAVLLVACGGDKDTEDTGEHTDHEHDADADTDADSDADADADADADSDADTDVSSQPVSIQFDVRLEGTEVGCGTYPWSGVPGELTIGDLRLYVSQISLIDGSGMLWPVSLTQDGLWQHQDLVLLDFEDATGSCVSTGTVETNTIAAGSVESPGPFTGIVFDLGVPESLNHQDATTAPSPLNLPAMFWGWQYGYKFVGIDLMAGAAPWFVHIGSTGCVSSDPLSPPDTSCSLQNRSRIRIEGGDPLSSVVSLDLGALLAGADLESDAAGSPPGCMSFPEDVAECSPIFSNLGLDYATGLCGSGTAECTTQSAFGWAP